MERKEYRLTDVCDFQGGTQPPKEEWINEPREGYIRMLQIRDFTKGRQEHIEFVKDTKKLNKCVADDILIGRYGASVGKILTGLAGAYNVAIIRTIPNEERLTKKFLYYLLKGVDFQNFISSIGARAAQAGFNKEDLSYFKLHLPSLQEQEVIVEVLSKLESIIKQRQKSIGLTGEFLKYKFLEMFKMFFDKPTKSLDSLAFITSGLTKGKKYGAKRTYFVPYMRVANVQDGYIDLDEIKEIEATEDEIKRYSLKFGDLLLTEGGDPDKLGRGTIWKNQIEGCIFQNHIFRVRVKSGLIEPVFLAFLTGSIYGKSYFLKSAKQTTGIASINSTQLKKFPVIDVPFDLQNKFSKIVNHIESLTISYSQSLKGLQELYNSLNQRAFRGNLNIVNNIRIGFEEKPVAIDTLLTDEQKAIDTINKELDEIHKLQPHIGAPEEIDNKIRQLEAELKLRGEIPFWGEYVKYRIVKAKFKEPFTFEQLWLEISKFPFETLPDYDEVATLLFIWLREDESFIRQQYNELSKNMELVVNETVTA